MCDLNNLRFVQKQTINTTRMLRLKQKTWVCITPSSGHGGWFFFETVQSGTLLLDVCEERNLIQSLWQWTVLGEEKGSSAPYLLVWICTSPTQDLRRSSISSPRDALLWQKKDILSLFLTISTREEQPPPKGQGSWQSPQPSWPAITDQHVTLGKSSPPGLNSLIYKQEVTWHFSFSRSQIFENFYQIEGLYQIVYWQ